MSVYDDGIGRVLDKIIDLEGSPTVTYTPHATGVAVVISLATNDQVGAEDNTGDSLFHIFTDPAKGVANPLVGDRIVPASGEKFTVTKVRLGSDGTAELRARSAEPHNP